MTIHVRRPEPQTAEECIARIKEQRAKIYGAQIMPQPVRMPEPQPAPIRAAPEPEPEPIISLARNEGEESAKQHRTRIIREIARKHGVSLAEMLGHDNRAHVVVARDEAIASVKAAYPKRSNTLVGQDFGGRDSSTILIAMRRAQKIPTGKERPRNGSNVGLDLRRLQAGLKTDIMRELSADGLTSRDIAELMECTADNVRRVTRGAKNQAEWDLSTQSAPAPSFLRRLLSRIRAIMGR